MKTLTHSFKKTSALLASGLLSLGLLTSPSTVFAAPSEALISQYNQAAAGDEDLVETVVADLTTLIDTEGAQPLSLVYLGSGQTLQGRDAFWPWNKMKLVEKGLATIDKGLNLMASQKMPTEQQAVVMGLPERYMARAIAATTYSQLPDMFNHFERGYDLYLGLLDEPYIQQAPFEATSWIYTYAIEAAIRAEDLNQAKLWLSVMEQRGPDSNETITAKSLINQA
ncbi:hypothetical protein [Vibrio tapetis]|uniref:Uncharacterized protein n=1 Tax=Vibrio tapetis subsp. tapetis TaxID=1671868 RepID=A0A2N8ZLV9_9VIBR|nr:hypothetical protein [Vibrio tapetis]SON52887.1 conserved exported protein of unknown function [Vibrio tapetis subsp. tapetis]